MVFTVHSECRESFHPRERGEHLVEIVADHLYVSPPRARRTSREDFIQLIGTGFTPASAENILACAGRLRRDGFHPRERGEHRFAGTML